MNDIIYRRLMKIYHRLNLLSISLEETIDILDDKNRDTNLTEIIDLLDAINIVCRSSAEYIRGYIDDNKK